MPTMFERSADTDSVVGVIRGVNDEITYQEAAKRARVSVERLKSILPSARRILMVENIVFDIRRGIGLVRLYDKDKVRLPSRRNKKMYNQAKYGEKELATITELSKLSPSEQVSVATSRTIFGLVRQQTRKPPNSGGQRDLP